MLPAGQICFMQQTNFSVRSSKRNSSYTVSLLKHLDTKIGSSETSDFHGTQVGTEPRFESRGIQIEKEGSRFKDSEPSCLNPR